MRLRRPDVPRLRRQIIHDAVRNQRCVTHHRSGCRSWPATTKTVVVHAKQVDDRGHIILGPDAVTHPASVGKEVMRFAPSCGYKRAPEPYGERQVRLTMAMQVSDLTLVEAELDPAKAMWAHLDSIPVGDDVDDLVLDFLMRHDFDRQNDRWLAGNPTECEARARLPETTFLAYRRFDSTIRVAMATGEL